jgi:hypothetical protein
MRRREFMGLLAGAVATRSLAARAQQPDRVRRIGVLIDPGWPTHTYKTGRDRACVNNFQPTRCLGQPPAGHAQRTDV